MMPTPEEEHRWLEQLTGDWSFSSEALMGADQPPVMLQGQVKGRMLGGMWFLAETNWESSKDGNECGDANHTVMALGYDPAKKKYVGSFIGSMMAQQWIYIGTLDEAKRTLTLDTVGPKFDGTGDTQYQDIVEIVGPNEWMLKSRILGDDGEWFHFMTATHRKLQ